MDNRNSVTSEKNRLNSFDIMFRRIARLQAYIAALPFIHVSLSNQISNRCRMLGFPSVFYCIAALAITEVSTILATVKEIEHQRNGGKLDLMVVHIVIDIYFALGRFFVTIDLLKKAQSFARLHDSCSKIQIAMEFDRCHHKALTSFCNAGLIFNLIVVVSCASLYIIRAESFVKLLGVGIDREPVIKTIIAFLLAVYSLFGITSLLSIMTWLCTFAEFFRLCFVTIEMDVMKIKPILSDIKGADRLSSLRLNYIHICDLVKEADNLMSAGSLLIFLGNLICCCFVGYHALHHDSPPSLRFIHIETFIFIFMSFLVITFSIQRMKDKASDIGTEISKLNGTDFTVAMRLEIFAFSSTCERIRPNFTGLKFFDIDLKLITSILSTVVTYIVIILQTSSTSSPGSCELCNSHNSHNATQFNNTLFAPIR